MHERNSNPQAGGFTLLLQSTTPSRK